ncbi:tetratricopeptide repeat protein [Niabella sp. 22666]|uniref:tetratricopeptide repeat protein n=1 Tax=Niabella sp. 22666 TaxID=3453954 RepID=UPI003F8772BA
MSADKNLKYIGVVLLAMLVLAYANHFNNGFHFDDSHTVVENVNIRTLENIPRFFTDATLFSVSQNHRGLRPLVTTSLAIDYWIAGGLNPWMFQLSTFLWHIGLCLMLYFMYRQLLSKTNTHKWVPFIALLGAGWFGIHTVGAETLNYIISRSDVLSTFFIVASFLTYVAYPEKRKYFLYVLLAVIGIFAKETVPVLPILLFFYILLFEKQLSLFDIFRKRNIGKAAHAVWVLLPLVIVIAAVQLYTLSKMEAQGAAYGMSNPLGYYLLTQTYVWFHYFRSFFLPYDLSADTDLSVITNLSDPRILIGVLFLITLIVIIFRTSHKKETRPISFGLIWFAVSLLPTSLVPFAEVMNDHRMYFAFAGLTLSVVTFLGLLAIKKEAYFEKKKNVEYLLMAAFLVIGLNAYGVFQRNQVWKTEETLWKDVTEKSPNNGRGWMNYGLSLMAKGDFKRAIEAYKRAEVTNPYYSYLFINFGIAYGALKDSVQAVTNFEKGRELAPNDYNGYVYYARYCFEEQRYEQARQLAEKANELNPSAYMPREILMGVYQALKMWPQLEEIAGSTLALIPGDAKTLEYLDAAKQKKTLVTKAAVSHTPPSDVLINLSLQQYTEGKYEDCIATCEIVLSNDPDNADAYNNMCAAYNMLKEWDKAKAACTKALQLKPDHPNAPANLKWAIEQKL